MFSVKAYSADSKVDETFVLLFRDSATMFEFKSYSAARANISEEERNESNAYWASPKTALELLPAL